MYLSIYSCEYQKYDEFMNEFSQIKTFVALVESRSISKAAEKMDIAVSAVSRRLKELESNLGAQFYANRVLLCTGGGARCINAGVDGLSMVCDEYLCSVSTDSACTCASQGFLLTFWSLTLVTLLIGNAF